MVMEGRMGIFIYLLAIGEGDPGRRLLRQTDSLALLDMPEPPGPRYMEVTI